MALINCPECGKEISDKAIDIINKWEPPVFLAEEIEKLNN